MQTCLALNDGLPRRLGPALAFQWVMENLTNLTDADRAQICAVILLALTLLTPFAIREAERWLDGFRRRAKLRAGTRSASD